MPVGHRPPWASGFDPPKRTGLSFEHFNIVLEIQDMPRAIIAARRHIVLPQLDRAGVNASLHNQARFQRPKWAIS